MGLLSWLFGHKEVQEYSRHPAGENRLSQLLYWAICQQSHYEVIKALNNGANPNSIMEDGRTLFQFVLDLLQERIPIDRELAVVSDSYLCMITAMLKRGASRDMLMCYPDVVLWLYKYGGIIEVKPFEILGSPDLIKFVGVTPMGLAIKSGSIYFVRSLLEDAGADPNAVADDNTGLTAFQMALEDNFLQPVAMMINHGASLEILRRYPNMIDSIKLENGIRDVSEARIRLEQYGIL